LLTKIWKHQAFLKKNEEGRKEMKKEKLPVVTLTVGDV
jgi:hypothetical protein